MNTLVAIAIAPIGQGEELAPLIRQVLEPIQRSGLSHRTHSMFTEIEGPWDDVMAVVKEATFVLAEQGYRTELVLKADVRPGHEDMMHKKVERVIGKGGDGDGRQKL